LELKITDHCIMRYIERSNIIERHKKKIKRIVECGIRIKPKYSTIKLINNGFKDAEYYMFGGLVAVVVKRAVVTVFSYNKVSLSKF